MTAAPSMLAPPTPATSNPSPPTGNQLASTPNPSSLPENFTMLDLEILHFWITESVTGFWD